MTPPGVCASFAYDNVPCSSFAKQNVFRLHKHVSGHAHINLKDHLRRISFLLGTFHWYINEEENHIVPTSRFCKVVFSIFGRSTPKLSFCLRRFMLVFWLTLCDGRLAVGLHKEAQNLVS
jgi:hypothetical protein